MDRSRAVKQLAAVKHLALDLDGTLYLGGKLFPFTLPFLRRAAELGLGRTFFTNNSSVSTRGYVEKLKKLGIDAAADEVHSSTSATLDYLREHRPELKSLFVLGTPALREEFAENGFRLTNRPDGGAAATDDDEPDAVIIGFDTTLDYPRLCRATYWIAKGKPYLATHGDAVCPTDVPTVLPDCGAICAMLAVATGRQPDAVLGKPAAGMLGGVMRRRGLSAVEVAVVGDRLYTDIAMARSAGAVGVLVLSGESTTATLAAAKDQPDIVVADVGVLGNLLAEAAAIA